MDVSSIFATIQQLVFIVLQLTKYAGSDLLAAMVMHKSRAVRENDRVFDYSFINAIITIIYLYKTYITSTTSGHVYVLATFAITTIYVLFMLLDRFINISIGDNLAFALYVSIFTICNLIPSDPSRDLELNFRKFDIVMYLLLVICAIYVLIRGRVINLDAFDRLEMFQGLLIVHLVVWLPFFWNSISANEDNSWDTFATRWGGLIRLVYLYVKSPSPGLAMTDIYQRICYFKSSVKTYISSQFDRFLRVIY